MTKIAVIFADGCEEIEGLSQIDVYRRLGLQADMVGLTSTQVTGSHKIPLTCDSVISDDLLDYDVVSLPGGLPGAEYLRDNAQLQTIMQKRHAAGKWNAAMCAAPIALARFGLLNDTDYTCYPGMDKQTKADAPTGRFHEDLVVVDNKQKIITSRGPATAWAFAYAIAESQGVNTEQLQDGMLYTMLKEHIND
ncbi:MAG: DJ-1/PfpI family protein [Lactobacillus sp.]|jgi:4-methyl-5(b-hydroxyethyl)-thiazole monophosphate biosynthesis|nr:DJ-1/PfpI family protein [Lactobacillus sp.]MCH3905910.1 DJ-1/PfpI family protein [Lactobacillus sp.]MCH3990514.1 DJ-1/PfpI family protein [Lactobacillus sp.]MCH4068771.1 DJ-1/PfpI family protein [Lactobacillus sp.]MCI1303744.1 DJ-1/PfpI family protein [Lactobacillus sp.]